MAVASAIDLGLHKDAAAYVESGSMSIDHYRLRNVAWWGTYIYERGWSVYVGRLPNAHKDISCAHPHASDDNILSFSGSLVSLLRITDLILEQLYSGGNGTQLSSARAAQLHTSLLQWHSSLPFSEQIDLDLQPSPPAQILLLQ